MMSPIGLFTPVLKPQIQHFDHHHLVFMDPEVTIFGQEVGADPNPRVSYYFS